MDMRYSLLGLLAFSAVATAAPVAVDDLRTIPANTPVTIDVLNNDTDPDGFTLFLDVESISAPTNGTVLVNEDGGITYTPNANYIGTDTFTYTVTSGDAEVSASATGTVTIVVSAPTLADRVSGSNTRSFARVIDEVCNTMTSSGSADLSNGALELANRCTELRNLALSDPEAAARAVRKIAPEETLALSKVGVSASEFQANVVGARLMQLGHGLSAANTGGLSWSSNFGGGAAGDESILAKIGLFASIQLEDADKDETLAESGFEYSATSLTAGADYAMNNNWFVGGALGLTSNDLDFKDDGGNVSSDIITFIGYTTYSHGNFSFDLQTGLGNSDIDLARNISYQTFDATTSGTTNGSQWFVSTQVQYLYSYKALTLFPSIKYNYMDSNVASYADTNARGWEVELGEQNVQQNTLELGLQATYAVNTSWGVFIPNLEVQLYDDLDTDQDILRGHFAFASGDMVEFGMYGEEPDSSYYQVGLGFSVVLPKGTSAFAGYRKTLGYQDYTASQVQAGLRMEF